MILLLFQDTYATFVQLQAIWKYRYDKLHLCNKIILVYDLPSSENSYLIILMIYILNDML